MRRFQRSRLFIVLQIVLTSTSALADGDAVKGKQLFNRCSSCHAIDGQNKSGPSLNGVIGRKAGSVEGYNYSPAMAGSNITWTDDLLDNYLAGPNKMIRGSRMSMSVQRQQDRADIISYLETLGSQ